MFIVLNIIQRMEARTRMKLLVKYSDFTKFSNDISNLTLKDFEKAAELVKKDPKAFYNPTIYKLLKYVQTASAKVQGNF